MFTKEKKTATAKRTLADFPAMTAANEKHAELKAGREGVATELRHVQSPEGRRERIEASADELLGGGAAVVTLPDVAELQEKIAAFDRAILRHEADVLRPARAEAVEAISSDYADEYRQALERLIALHVQFDAAVESVYRTLNACKSACRGECRLPVVTVAPLPRNQLRYSLEVLKEQTARFRAAK